jgi:hypothetical protein
LSRSNYLIKSVSRYVKLTKQDFENAVFIKWTLAIISKQKTPKQKSKK